MQDGWICDPDDARNESWMSDAPWFKANEPHGHRYMVRTKSGVSHCHVGMGFVGHKDILRQLFYGNSFERSSEMMGLSACYATRDLVKAQNAVNVLDAGGNENIASIGVAASGRSDENLTSIWLVGWGPQTVYMVTPDGMPPASAGEAAITILDWRFIVRIANIDINVPYDFEALIDRALFKLPIPLLAGDKRAVLRPAIYMHSKIKGEMIERRGIFIRAIDDIRCDEERVI